MDKKDLAIGAFVKLYSKYHDGNATGIIVGIDKSEYLGEGGWISFAYSILTQDQRIIYCTESAIAEVIAKAKKRPVKDRS